MRIPPFKLERYFARHEFTARYLLCSSDCESFAIRDLLALEPDAADRFHSLRLGYVEPVGGAAVRSAIARQYAGIEPDEILVHAGAQEAIFIFANAVLAPGDHVIVQTPCYQSLLEVARAAGCMVSEWSAEEGHALTWDVGCLAHRIRPETRAIVINTPHNPSGYLMPASVLREVIALAERRGIFVFADEVYRLLEHEEALRPPAACELYDRAISLGVMSKNLGLAGLRVGWIATRDRQVREAMAAFKDYTSICATVPGEFLSALALAHRETLLSRNLRIIRENLSLLDAFFARFSHVFDWHRPSAGPIAFPRVRGDVDVDVLCDDVIEQTGVLLLPGSVYESERRSEHHHLRVGFGRANMPEALARLDGYLSGRFPG